MEHEGSLHPTVSILIVEDEPVFRMGLRAAFDRFANRIEIVGEATNAEEAVESVRNQIPDVVLLDLRLPDHRGMDVAPAWQHGVAAIRQIARVAPHTRVLVLSYKDEPEVLFAALHAGADGYITKGDGYDGVALVDAVQRVIAGEAIYGPLVAQCIRAYHQRVAARDDLVEPLTRRERQILDLLADQATNQEIADALVISVRTVKTHVANILAKLHLASRHEIPTYLAFTNHE
jgi:NarL family two-component system response regulator LiaR